jgi:hypothetical protein
MDHALIRRAILLNSALYLTGCFVAGMVLGVPLAWKAALVTVGISYLCYMAQDMGAEGSAKALMLASIGAGVAAGLPLLFV